MWIWHNSALILFFHGSLFSFLLRNYFQIEREEDSDKSEGKGFQVGRENHFKVNIGKASEGQGNNAGANPSFKVNFANRMKMNLENDNHDSKDFGFNSNKAPHKDVFSGTLYRNGAKAVGNGLNNTRFSQGAEPTLMTKRVPTNYENGETSFTNQNLNGDSSMNNSLSNASTTNSGVLRPGHGP